MRGLLFFKEIILLIIVTPTISYLFGQATTTNNYGEMVKYDRMQLSFEENRGQMDEQVLFRANDAQATHFFLKNEIRSAVKNAETDE